jgi:hypothetical protein
MRKTLIAALVMAAATVCHGMTYKDMLAAFWAKSGSPAAPVLGGAVDLDGGEYFSDSSSTLLNGATNFSFTAWVMNGNANPAYDGIICSRSSGNQITGLVTSGSFNNPPNRFLFFINNAVNVFSSVTSYTNMLSRFGFVVAVYDGSKLKMFCDLSYTETSSAGLTNFQNDVFRIGFDDFASDRKFIGLIDDVSIWNRALTSNEVVELYNGGVGKPIASMSTGTNGLVRYWKLDDNFAYPAAALTQAVDSVSGTFAAGTGINSNDFVTGIVPQ